MKNILLSIVLLMIAYDLSIHLIYLLKKEAFWLDRGINYWPEGSRQKYQIFWSVFWAAAFALVLISLLI